MARITVERSHTLGLDGARAKAEELAERLAAEYAVRYQWKGDVLEFKRSGADGTINVAKDTVRVELSLGLLLSAMSGTIKREIEKGLDESLS
ncbi:polyhydroxyalkanoic acid system family protein [Pseudomonas sp. GV071]|jgi:putative polyhydroxyalkanoate system protein|uniref:polyhydroxyalkanoic acid system family protein n=1 Tax=Pseudomonas sp. GV071 TaxID=2135754 RepID=UPI000D3BE393|nr:polyhydroxyalkanoic acid system family protein [Pseudomonas sp. GV071]PTQ70927.1 putative polyhydroxyalkanoate system protein [Pseudomonas sp. GV071]